MAKKHDLSTWSPNQVVEYVLHNYFRRRTNQSLDRLLDKILNLPYYQRIKIAEKTTIPEIVDTLTHDVDSLVREAARRNPYWKLLGQYKSLLKMQKSDKIRFIQKESLQNLLVFLVFETDPDVLEALFENSTVSLSHLHTIQKLLQERGFGANDDLILERLEAVIERKRLRIRKIYDILKFKHRSNDEGLATVLLYILDTDPIVKQAALNALEDVPQNRLYTFLATPDPFQDFTKDSVQTWWNVVTNLALAFDHQYRMQANVAAVTGVDVETEDAHPFTELKLQIVEHAGSDLSNHDCFLTLVNAHLDPDETVQQKAASIIRLEEILELIEDDTFPQAFGKQAIKILLKHPLPALQPRINQALMKLSERTRRQLKEMETTINAYLDIIFNSLGYPQILKIRQTLKIIKEARNLSEAHLKEEIERNPEFAAQAAQLRKLFLKIENYYLNKLKEIYQSITPAQQEELIEIYEMITIIGKIPEEVVEKEGYTFLTASGDYATQLRKAQLVWRSTLGQYLGRLKEFEEILQHKWISILPPQTSRLQFHRDMLTVQQELEQEYKQRVNCHLTIACAQCSKRMCAAERYFIQVEFLLGEMIDYLKLQKDG